MKQMTLKFTVIGIMALVMLLISSAEIPASSEIIFVRMEVPDTVYSGNCFTVHVNLANNKNKPINMKKWFVVLGFKDLTIQGPFVIGQGPIGIINPGQATNFSFTFRIDCPSKLRNTMVPFTLYLVGERSAKFGTTYLPVTEILGGHMRQINGYVIIM